MLVVVSVVIPTYNREDLVFEAVNTVLEQTYQSFEVIVVDDGSTDNTREVIENINDPRVRYVYQKNSGKPSVARNIGVGIAQGEYIAFLDSDDLWHPQKLEKQIAVLENNLNVGLVTSWSLYKTFEGKELMIKKYQAKNQEENILYILTAPDKVFTGTPTLLIRKECFDKVGHFDEELTFCEDWDLFFRIALEYEVQSIPETLTYVQMHPDSMCGTPNAEKFREGYLRFLNKSFENKKMPKERLSIKSRAYGNALWCVGSFALYKAKNYLLARKSLLESLGYDCGKALNVKFLVALFLSYSPCLLLKIYEGLRKSYKNLLGRIS